MKKKNIEITKNYYDGIAKGYNSLYEEEQNRKIQEIIKYLPNEGKILDIGAGTGIINRYLNHKEDLILISLDISKEMLKLNSNKEENKFQASAEKIPFEDNSFDHCISFTVFQDLSNPKKAVRETYRVLKNKGVLILSFLKISSKYDEILNEIFKYFQVIKKINTEKDIILILKKN